MRHVSTVLTESPKGAAKHIASKYHCSLIRTNKRTKLCLVGPADIIEI